MDATTRFQFICFGFGQVIMLLNASTGVLSKYLTLEEASVPTLQSTFLYVFLAIVNLAAFRIRKQSFIGVPWWFYALLGFVDVEANYFAVKAFGYANYATLLLLLNLTIPFVTLFTYIFLKTRYRNLHYLGAAIAVAGCVVIFISDYTKDMNGETFSRELKGDIMGVIAAALYATSNVMFQSIVKVRDLNANIEALGFLGLWAAIVSCVQIALLEREPIQSINWNSRVVAYMVAYVLIMFTFYSITSIFLRWAESLMFNLNLLTAPIFTVFASYYLFDEPVKPLYWGALALFYIGLTLYCLTPPPAQQATASTQPEDDFKPMKSPVGSTVDVIEATGSAYA